MFMVCVIEKRAGGRIPSPAEMQRAGFVLSTAVNGGQPCRKEVEMEAKEGRGTPTWQREELKGMEKGAAVGMAHVREPVAGST